MGPFVEVFLPVLHHLEACKNVLELTNTQASEKLLGLVLCILNPQDHIALDPIG